MAFRSLTVLNSTKYYRYLKTQAKKDVSANLSVDASVLKCIVV